MSETLHAYGWLEENLTEKQFAGSSVDKAKQLDVLLKLERKKNLKEIHFSAPIDFDREVENRVEQIVNFPEKKNRPFDTRNYFLESQNWIGYVTLISDDSFTAIINDTLNNSGTYEEVEFELSDIDRDDCKLIKIGSVFYWSVGIEYRNGTRSRTSLIRFKRLPNLSTTVVDNATDMAKDLSDNINWVE